MPQQDNRPLNACLILDDHLRVSDWQYQALEKVIQSGLIQVNALVHCQNTHHQKSLFKNFLYYILRAVVMRPKSWRHRNLDSLLPKNLRVHRFNALYEGIWQRIPPATLKKLENENIEVAIKFGMGLLKGAEDFPSTFGILSYHHGDPSKYRGRPAGFYEIYNGEGYTGAIVQKLSDKLDQGDILAFGAYPINPLSYNKSLETLFSGSSELLRKAIFNVRVSKTLPVKSNGSLYKLPSNLRVFCFLCKQIKKLFLKLIYGAFYEKKWRVAETKIEPPQLITDLTLLPQCAYPLPKNSDFVADCFYSMSTSQIFCESLNSKTQKGELLLLGGSGDAKHLHIQDGVPRHQSYPYSILHEETEFILPETSSFLSPTLFALNGDHQVIRKLPLKGLEDTRLLDPSLVHWQGQFWLFGCPKGKSHELHVWHSEYLEGPYTAHCHNPVVQDPRRARPGGRLFVLNDKLYRPGQVNDQRYGGGICLSEITQLSHDDYNEIPVSSIQVQGYFGPHTLDIKNGRLLFDYYDDKLSLLAFWRRIRNRL